MIRNLKYSKSHPMNGQDVSDLQKDLTELGFNIGSIDGIFGPITEEAVLTFQKNNGLYIDGVVGPETRNRLDLVVLKKKMAAIQNTSTTTTELGLFSVIGLDMCGGDYASRKVNNLDEAIHVAKEWVIDQTKCATYFESDTTVYLKITRDCNPSVSPNHDKCTSIFKGKSLQ